MLPLWHSKAVGYKDLKHQLTVLKKQIQQAIDVMLPPQSGNLNSTATCISLTRITLDYVFDAICMAMKYGELKNAIGKMESLLKSIENSIVSATSNTRLVKTLSTLVERLGPLYTEAIHVEYEYRVRREQAKAEQAEIRRRIQEERAEQKCLAEEKQKLDAEREKYIKESDCLNELKIDIDDDSKLNEIEKAINDIENSLSELNEKADEIIKLQNGKAGTVYN